MAFKASKKRERKPPEPIAQGTQLIASAPVRNWYERELRALTKAMLEDYRAELLDATESRSVAKVFSLGDASATETMKSRLDKLRNKWKNIFEIQARRITRDFMGKVDKHSETTVRHSLSVAGVQEPRMRYTDSVMRTLEASEATNYTLITNLQAEAHEKLFNAVMMSLSSPDPEKQGIPGIKAALQSVSNITGNRAESIARDQNSKVYSSLNIQRMKDNNVAQFRWIHSSAGKIPRPSHVDKDMEIFDIDDPRLWEGNKADQGPPGWAINCRCRAVPVINF